MPPLRAALLLLAGTVACAGRPNAMTQPPSISPSPLYPPSRTDDSKETRFGVEVRDPYRWLEASTPEVADWVKAESEVTRRYLSALPKREELANRLRDLFYIERQSMPDKKGGRYFYTRRSPKEEKAVLYVREAADGKERVLLDPNTWPEGEAVSLGGYWPSWDGSRLAFSLTRNHADMGTLHVMDVATGARSAVDVIPRFRDSEPSWTPSGDGFYYNRLPDDPSVPEADLQAHAEVRFHALGKDPREDRLVHERTGDASVYQSASLSKDGHWLTLVVSRGWSKNDVFVRDLRAGADSPWRPLVTGKDAKASAYPYRDRFYVQTDLDAPRGRLVVIDPSHPEPEAWKEIVPQRVDAALDGFSIVGGQLALRWIKDATFQLEIRGLDGALVRPVDLPGLGTVDGPLGDEDDDEAYFGFASYTVPPEIRRFSVKSGNDSVWHRAKPPVDLSPYEAREVFFQSKDGTRVPMFVVSKKGAPLDGTARAILTGYGGFNVSITPSYSSIIPAWLEQGGVFVEAVLRGGGEYGEAWHRAGMGRTKQRVFDDFLGAAEELVRLGVTRPGRLAIYGGSNGGLLVAAAVTQRPDLFGAALCEVPLTDMIRYPRVGQGMAWVPEYGSPEDEGDFHALYAYSPYHQVKPAVRYPPVLFLSADSDDRVDPMHARKMAAALQAASTGGPVLLRVEKQAGHGGADQVKAWVEKQADEYAFLLHEMK